MDTIVSGSIRNWRHTPNLTPRGSEIKRDELYVLPGETIIKAYNLIMSVRTSTLLTLSRTPPNQIEIYDEYVDVAKHINNVLSEILSSMSLATILQMQEEAQAEKKQEERVSKDGMTLKEILDKYHLSAGDKDERKKPPQEPGNENPTN